MFKIMGLIRQSLVEVVHVNMYVAYCGLTPMTRESWSFHEHIINWAIGASRRPVLDCGTTFHPDYGSRDCPSTPLDNLSNLNYLVTEMLIDCFEFIDAIQINLAYLLEVFHRQCATYDTVSQKYDHIFIF